MTHEVQFMDKLTQALAALALTLGAATALADGLVYVGAGITDSKLDDIGSDVAHISDNSWKAFLGTRPVRFFGFEGDYIDLGSHTDQYLGTGGGAVHSAADAFAAYGVGYLPLPVPFLDVYGKAGLARWELQQNTYGFGGFPFYYSDRGTDFAWGLGAQAHIGNIGARLEYERFNVANTNGARVFSLDAVLSLF
jgi:hypothetical protein